MSDKTLQQNCSTSVMFAAGLSSGGKAALFYAAQVSNIPAVFLGEPDDIAILSGRAHTCAIQSYGSIVLIEQHQQRMTSTDISQPKAVVIKMISAYPVDWCIDPIVQWLTACSMMQNLSITRLVVR